MKRLALGFVLGVVATVMGTYAWVGWRAHQWQGSAEKQIHEAAEAIVNHELSGARVLDVSWSPAASARDHGYDKMWDVHVTYERARRIKAITIRLGVAGTTWISPSKAELEILDDTAEVIHVRTGNTEQPHRADAQGRRGS